MTEIHEIKTHTCPTGQVPFRLSCGPSSSGDVGQADGPHVHLVRRATHGGAWALAGAGEPEAEPCTLPLVPWAKATPEDPRLLAYLKAKAPGAIILNAALREA